MTKQFVSATLSLIFFTAAVSAQSAAEQAAKNAHERFSDIKNRSFEMERMKRDANKKTGGGNTTPKFPQIKEDFEEIQKISSTVLEITSAAKTPLNYAAILKFASELSQRAARLKSNLFADEPAANKTVETSQPIVVKSQDISSLAQALNKSVNNFAHNSLFQNVNLVNTQDSLDAQRDLESVAKISLLIKEKAKKLKKEISIK